MSDNSSDLDHTGEEAFTCEVSDEELEAAAGAAAGGWTNDSSTWGVCC